MNQNPPSAVEWSCFAVLAGVAVAPLDHKDISAKIYIMKLPTTAPTQKFPTKTKYFDHRKTRSISPRDMEVPL